MDNLTKKDIDNIYQKVSKRQKFQYSESSWDSIDKMLDKRDQRKKKRRFGIPILLSSGLLIISLATYSLRDTVFNSKRTNSSLETTELVENKLETKAKRSVENSTFSESITVQKSASSLEDISDAKKEKIATVKKIDQDKLKVNKDRVVRSNSINQPESIKPSANNNTSSSTIITPDTPVQSQNEYVGSAINNSNTNKQNVNKIDEVIIDTQNSKTQNIILNKLIPTEQIDNISIKEVKHNENFGIAKEIELKKVKSNRFRLGVIAGKEWSTVGKSSNVRRSSNARDGFRIGLDLGYEFGNKFLISSGLIFSKKNYQTEGSNYTPQPQHRWADGVAPATIDGECDVFEIPLALSYFFKGNSVNSFYASAGITSYLMNQEEYNLVFRDPIRDADPNVPKRISSTNEDSKQQHYFGIGTVSIGYQKYINRSTSIQIEPYLQIPFTGIGLGQVDLISTGVQVKIAFRKK